MSQPRRYLGYVNNLHAEINERDDMDFSTTPVAVAQFEFREFSRVRANYIKRKQLDWLRGGNPRENIRPKRATVYDTGVYTHTRVDARSLKKKKYVFFFFLRHFLSVNIRILETAVKLFSAAATRRRQQLLYSIIFIWVRLHGNRRTANDSCEE